MRIRALTLLAVASALVGCPADSGGTAPVASAGAVHSATTPVEWSVPAGR